MLDENYDLEALEEIENVNEEEILDNDGDLSNYDTDFDISIEGIQVTHKSIEEEEEEFISIPGINEFNDDSAEPFEEVCFIYNEILKFFGLAFFR